MNKLPVSFVNVKNIQSNYIYAQKLIREHQITFMSETWLSELNRDFLLDIAPESKVFSREDFVTVQKGRPFGGIGWILDKELKVLHHEFLNNRVSYIVTELENVKWIIIGVYMPFDDNKFDSLSEFETNLAIISELVNCYKRMGDYNIIIGGDFNADWKRGKKRFDRSLANFFKKEKIIIGENVNSKSINYTYFTDTCKACLDHVGIISTRQLLIDNKTIIKSKILEDIINTSDHHPVSIEIMFESQNKADYINDNVNITENVIRIFPDLENIEIKEIFVNNVQILLREKMANIRSIENDSCINDIYISINTTIKEVYESLITVKTKYYKTNEWWSRELKDIKSEMLYIKKKFKNLRGYHRQNYDEEDKVRLKELKKLFRNQQRINIRNKDFKKFTFIEELAKEKKNKKFWGKVKDFHRKSKLTVNIPLEKLEKHFKEIFNKEESDLSGFHLHIKDEVNSYENSINLNSEETIEFNDFEIDTAIKESKNSRAIGPDNICPYWLKNSNSQILRYFIKKLFDNIYKGGSFPMNFNLCKLSPLIKDYNKANDDTSNIRPISISSSPVKTFSRRDF